MFTTAGFTTIVLPNTLTEIGTYMFYGCENLTDIHFVTPQDLPKEGQINIINTLESTSVVELPNSVTYIGTDAFSSLKKIAELVIPRNDITVESNIALEWLPSQYVSVNFEVNETPASWDLDWIGANSSSTIATVLYAGTYNIVYHLDSGINAVENPASFTSRSEISFKPATRLGYTFLGWYSDADLTNQCSSISKGTAGELNLYAKWEVNGYTIQYYKNQPEFASESIDGSTASSDHFYDIAKPLNNNGFSLLGWTFIGWNTQADGSGISFNNGQSVLNLTEEVGTTVQIFAQWTANQYVIDYISNKPNNASGELIGNSYTSNHYYDEEKQLVSDGYDLIGWHLTGWNTKADGTGVAFTPTERLKNLTNIPNGNYVIYAQWAQNEYDISYMANLPSDASGQVVGTMSNSHYFYEEEKALTPNVFTLLGWHFTGWNSKADGSGKAYSNSEIVGKIQLPNSAILNIYAQWERNEYTIQYNANKPTNASSNVENQVQNSTHYYDLASNLNKNIFTLIGWDFKGWSKTSNGAVEFLDEATVLNWAEIHGITIQLHAVWQARTYYIEYASNKPSNAYHNISGNMNSSKHIYDSTTKLTQIGYTLNNWDF